MSAASLSASRKPAQVSFYAASWLDTLAAWLLALLWILPLVYAVWTAFHPSDVSTRFDLSAPWTLQNFRHAWEAAPFARYFLNTFMLVSLILAVQLLLSTLAAFAFARYRFRGSNVAFALVLVQLMIMPDILLVANYQTMAKLGAVDTLVGIGLPYFASAFAIFCCARHSWASLKSWMKLRVWKVQARCRFCGAFMCRWPGRCTRRLRWCRSAFTGTIFSGRSSSPTVWKRARLPWGCKFFPVLNLVWNGPPSALPR